MAEAKPLRRRSGLVQERSRRTRQRLIRAALEIWSQRGFDSGVEQTTVEEIVQAAGVTKGTFYFHFARKEEILLEMGWDTAAEVNLEVERCLDAGLDIDASLERVLRVLSRHVKAAPPGAVGRAVAEFRRTPGSNSLSFHRDDFRTGLEALFRTTMGDGPAPGFDPFEVAQVLSALWLDSMLDWSLGDSDLETSLGRRTRLVMAGLRAVPHCPGGPAGDHEGR